MVASSTMIICGDLAVNWDTLVNVIAIIMGNGLSRLLRIDQEEPNSLFVQPEGYGNSLTLYGLRLVIKDPLKERLDVHCLGFLK